MQYFQIFLDHVSKNKCVVCIGGPYLNDMKDGEHNKKYIEMINSVGTIFCSDEFDHLGVVKKLITDLGHRYGDKNIMLAIFHIVEIWTSNTHYTFIFRHVIQKNLEVLHILMIG